MQMRNAHIVEYRSPHNHMLNLGSIPDEFKRSPKPYTINPKSPQR